MVPGTELKPSRVKTKSSSVEFYTAKYKWRRNQKIPYLVRGSDRHNRHQTIQESLSRRAQRSVGQKIKQSSMRKKLIPGKARKLWRRWVSPAITD